MQRPVIKTVLPERVTELEDTFLAGDADAGKELMGVLAVQLIFDDHYEQLTVRQAQNLINRHIAALVVYGGLTKRAAETAPGGDHER